MINNQFKKASDFFVKQLLKNKLSSTNSATSKMANLMTDKPKNDVTINHEINIDTNTHLSNKEESAIIDKPLNLAVVGHTNTGKTSILRTLLRDSYFGAIQNSAATTRHVERALITSNLAKSGNTLDKELGLIALFDTPGLEDASGVMDWLENHTSSLLDGVDRLKAFLASDLAQAAKVQKLHNSNDTVYDFSQEAKVIKQLLNSDMAIYVIDAREPVLGKYKDELTILSWSAVPIMPVFNFTTDANNCISEWQNMLARRNFHVTTLFDSIAFEFNDEMNLWKNIATMLNNNPILNTLIECRKNDWQQIYDDAEFIIADFLLNLASFAKEIQDEKESLSALKEMQEVVRQAERMMHQQLLDLYKFYDSSVESTALNLDKYQQDPFDSNTLKNYGIRTSSGAATGALVGMGIDTAALGTTLGLGTAVGGLVGGVLSNTSKITDIIKGTKHLFIDPATLTLLATRANILHDKLRHRGHASNNKNITTDVAVALQAAWKVDKLPSELKKARSKPEWSSVTATNSKTAALLRKNTASSLAKKLTKN